MGYYSPGNYSSGVYASGAVAGFDPETASVVVSGAGTATSNGTYTRAGSLNGKPYYTKNGGMQEIAWNGITWELNDFDLGSNAYVSLSDVAYPWLAAWEVADADSPVPTVEALGV